MKRIALLAVLLVLVLGTTRAAVKAEKSTVAKGYLGVAVEQLSDDDEKEFGATSGVLVTQVVKESPAAKAGVKKYDVIQYFNDEKLRHPEDLIEAVSECNAGSKAQLKLMRDGKPISLAVTLDQRQEKVEKEERDIEGKDEKEIHYFHANRGGAYLGVTLLELDKEMAAYFSVKEDGGALVTAISKEGPAEKAGLKSGDVIIKVGEKQVGNPDDVRRALRRLEKGDKVPVVVVRHGKEQTLSATLSANHSMNNFLPFFDKGNFQQRFFNVPGLEHNKVEIRVRKHPDGHIIINGKEFEGAMTDVHKELEKIKPEIEAAIKMSTKKAHEAMRHIKELKLDKLEGIKEELRRNKDKIRVELKRAAREMARVSEEM